MASELRPGDRIAGCVIEAELGRGGMGAVYRARQESLRRLVAVKIISSALSDDAGFARRFEREAHLAAAIEHPSVVPIYAAGEEAGRLYLVMRYIAGTDLAGIVLERGALAPRRAAAIGRALGSALDAAHARGLVHRDVKPANVLLAGGEGDEHALLTDFGLSKESTSQSGLTATGHWLGTLDYVAPEQLEGRELDARADVYSLGCLLFECLSGRVPFEGTPAAKLFAHASRPPPSLASVDATLAERVDPVLARAMAKDPVARHPSAGDLGRALESAIEGRAAPAERSVAAVAATVVGADVDRGATVLDERPLRGPRQLRAQAAHAEPAPRRRAGVVAAAGVLILLAGLGLGAAFAINRDGGERPTQAATPSERRVETVTGMQPPAEPESPPATDPEVGASDDWPLDRSAYTVVLRSTTTRAQADATSTAGAETGLPAGGVLDSGDFQSLRPGYWVAFSGAVASEAEATTIAEQALDAGFEDAYVRFVSAG